MIPDTIETKTSDFLTHSKLGVASCVIAVVVSIYFFVAGYISLLIVEDFFKDSTSSAALGFAVIAFFFHLALCGVGFLIGTIFGSVGMLMKNKKRLFPIIGLILNLLPLLSAIIFTIYFFN